MATALLTAAEENYLRMVRIVICDVPTKLRNMFKGEFASKYRKQYADDTASGQFFLNKSHQRCKDSQVKAKLHNGNSAEFDSTTLFFCLLYSGELLQPGLRQRNARVPPLHDSELVDQLREQRNLVAHSATTEITQQDFRIKISDLQTIYQDLAWQTTELLHYANDPLDTQQCASLRKDLLKEMTRNNALDQMVKNHDVRLQAVEGDVQGIKGNVQGLDSRVTGAEGTVQRLGSRLTDVEEKLQGDKDASENIKDLLKEALRKRYSHHSNVVAPVDSEEQLSLDKAYVDLRLQKYDVETLPETVDDWDVSKMEERMQRNPVVPLSNLFDKLDEEVAPKKLLIRGKPGIGKTTCVGHVASQWAVGSLWQDDIDYPFLITLRNLRQNKMWTLDELLLANLPLSANETRAALSEIHRNANRVLIILDGLDELRHYEHTSEMESDCSASIELSLLVSSILDNSMLPGARVLVTSRSFPQIPSKSFQRIVEIYGFPRESIDKYVHLFSADNADLEQFIQKNLQKDPNLRTFCYVPLQCLFVLSTLRDKYMHSSSTDVPIMKTTTQLYLNATISMVQQLHPQLKGIKTEMDVEDVLQVVKESFMKYARLAKRLVKASPPRLVFYKKDLRSVDMCCNDTKDMQCGFITASLKSDPNMINYRTHCWSFNHLTLQEYFAAIGFLEESVDDIVNLLQDKAAIYKLDILCFIAGLLGNTMNARYIKLLLPEVSLAPRNIIMKLAPMFDHDPLKLITVIHETQDPGLVDIVSCGVSAEDVSPTEMRALSWALQQTECPITAINLRNINLDDDLVMLLSCGLNEKSTVRTLLLHNCDIQAIGMEALTQALIHRTDMELLDLGQNTIDNDAGHHLGDAINNMTRLEKLGLSNCSTPAGGMKALTQALIQCTAMTTLILSRNTIDNDSGHRLGDAVKNMTRLEQLKLENCNIPAVGMNEVTQALVHSTAMKTLVLDQNTIGIQAGRHLSDAVKNMTRLKKLSLDNCNTPARGMKVLMQALKQCSAMQCLWLADNNVDDEMAIDFVMHAMVELPLLVHIGLQENFITAAGVQLVNTITSQCNRNIVDMDFQLSTDDSDATSEWEMIYCR